MKDTQDRTLASPVADRQGTSIGYRVAPCAYS